MAASRKSPKSLRSEHHLRLRALLVQLRAKAELRQSDVAKRLGRPQSYVAKYEGGERRLDVIEFLAVCEALEADPIRVIRNLKD